MMAVYVDRARNALGRMKMCHMIADTPAELHGMAERIGLRDGPCQLSGYPIALYDKALAGWARIERAALADGAKARTEVLWINCAGHAGHGLFEQRPES